METTTKPRWLLTDLPRGKVYFEVKKELRAKKLFTVCEEAKCPNIGECWNTRTATFMVMGDTCTRGCRFCNVKTGNPGGWLDPQEPEHVAQSCKTMGLEYVVITMVDRDDLEDGGASHVAQVVTQVKQLNPSIKVELLAGDFRGSLDSLAKLVGSGVHVYAHNLETVRRLTPRVRDARATYDTSLQVLAEAKQIKVSTALPQLFTKSALMLGLGETYDEIVETLVDLRERHVDFITIGQYMRPTKKHLSVKEWVAPEVFQRIGEKAKELGFLGVASAPLVRSSYKAKEFYLANVGGS